MDPVLEFKNVSRSFALDRGFFSGQGSIQAVSEASFVLESGKALGLVGESGCGKSTVGRMAAGLLSPTSGEVLFRGRPLQGLTEARGRLQMIFQDPFSSLNPRLSIGASIAEPLAAQGMPKEKRREAVAEMLKLIGLFPEQAGRFPHQFSGGQRQRIAVARALITRPDVVVCDEPVSALDVSVQAQILNLLCDVRDTFSPAYLFISHDLAVVGFMCPKIMVMYLGRVVEEAPREKLLKSPAHPYSQALLAAMPEPEPGVVPTEHLRGEPPSPLDPPQGCAFHPRCPRAMEACREKMPPWTELGDGARVRCFLFG